MIDRIQLRRPLTPSEVDKVVHTCKLMPVNSDNVKYKSGPDRKLTGVTVKIDTKDVAHIACSLHKIYNKNRHGRLDNTGICTVGDIRFAALELLPRLVGVDTSRATIRTVEIGMTMTMEHDPTTYVGWILSITERNAVKEFFTDPDYMADSLKTTIRKNARHSYKIYSKTREIKDKRRTAAARDAEADRYLRIETKHVYKDKTLPTLAWYVSTEHLRKLMTQFVREWSTAKFAAYAPETDAAPSEADRWAAMIQIYGITEFRRQTDRMFDAEAITAEGYKKRMMFAEGWDNAAKRYAAAKSPYGDEFLSAVRMYALAIKDKAGAGRAARCPQSTV